MLLLLLAVAAGDSTVSLTADTSTVRLSGVVRLTLAVEGPTPLRVEPPAELLDAESAAGWKLTADGPPTTEGGRWVQKYVADPFAPGEAVRLGLNPVSVWANGASEPQWLTPTPLTVRVTTGVADVSAASARPPTGVESLAEPPPPDKPIWLLSAVGVAAVVAVVIALLMRQRQRVAGPLTAAEWFERTLADLSTGDHPPAEFAHRLSEAVRHVLHTPDSPARHLTTPELPPGPARDLLARLDTVRFGDGSLTAEDRSKMLAEARTRSGATHAHP